MPYLYANIHDRDVSKEQSPIRNLEHPLPEILINRFLSCAFVYR
jgi:hypothetical protein